MDPLDSQEVAELPPLTLPVAGRPRRRRGAANWAGSLLLHAGWLAALAFVARDLPTRGGGASRPLEFETRIATPADASAPTSAPEVSIALGPLPSSPRPLEPDATPVESSPEALPAETVPPEASPRPVVAERAEPAPVRASRPVELPPRLFRDEPLEAVEPVTLTAFSKWEDWRSVPTPPAGRGAEPRELPAGHGREAAPAVPEAGGGAVRPPRPRPGAGTSFFGIESTARRVAYVIDGSESMAVRGALARATDELRASVEDLPARTRFQVVLFKDEPHRLLPADDRDPMVVASVQSKRALAKLIAAAMPSGGSDRVAALLEALRGKPDAIFLLTDAGEPGLSERDLALLRKGGRGCVVHVVEFGEGPAAPDGNFLTRLARQQGGEYRYVDLLGP